MSFDMDSPTFNPEPVRHKTGSETRPRGTEPVEWMMEGRTFVPRHRTSKGQEPERKSHPKTFRFDMNTRLFVPRTLREKREDGVDVEQLMASLLLPKTEWNSRAQLFIPRHLRCESDSESEPETSRFKMDSKQFIPKHLLVETDSETDSGSEPGLEVRSEGETGTRQEEESPSTEDGDSSSSFDSSELQAILEIVPSVSIDEVVSVISAMEIKTGEQYEEFVHVLFEQSIRDYEFIPMFAYLVSCLDCEINYKAIQGLAPSSGGDVSRFSLHRRISVICGKTFEEERMKMKQLRMKLSPSVVVVEKNKILTEIAEVKSRLMRVVVFMCELFKLNCFSITNTMYALSSLMGSRNGKPPKRRFVLDQDMCGPLCVMIEMVGEELSRRVKPGSFVKKQEREMIIASLRTLQQSMHLVDPRGLDYYSASRLNATMEKLNLSLRIALGDLF